MGQLPGFSAAPPGGASSFVDVSGESLGEPDSVEEIKSLRSAAASKHTRRALGMIASAIAIGLAFAFVDDAILIVDANKAHLIKDVFAGSSWPYMIVAFFPTIILSAILVVLFSYYQYYRVMWFNHEASAIARATVKMMDGFNGIFRIYAKTKRLTITGYFAGVWGFFVYFVYIIRYSQLDAHITTPQLVTLPALSFLMIALAFSLATSFLPGRTFLNELMVINERSNHSYGVPEGEARGLHRLATDYRAKKSWWFY